MHLKINRFTFAKIIKIFQTLVVMDAKMLLIMAHLLLIVPLQSHAQVYDDFSDGDFTENPTWTGTDNLFKINAEAQLQLYADAGGDAYLFCMEQLSYSSEYEWHFWLREAFSPSANNYCDIVLCDNYFIRFGEAGSNDVLELFRQDGASYASVCRGTDTFIASAFAACFKVTHDTFGTWKIFVDKDGYGEYILDSQGVDNTYSITGSFGIKATFTSSNAKKIYLDDVYFGPLIVDTEPPVLDDVIVLKYNKLQLDFNEPLDEISALNSDNYLIDNQIGKPMYAEFNGGNRCSVILSFSNTIHEGIDYTLTINQINDLEGNTAQHIQYTFLYYTTHENDIVINEIMADPEPVVGLPPWEYIELYNITDYPINLKDWILVVGSSEKIISQDVDIQPDDYVILCKTDAVADLEEYGVCIDFASFSIVNSGVAIVLKDAESKLISDVRFDLSWYHDSSKTDGGWSLEQVDPSAPCSGADNWRASRDRKGGSPGTKNSVDAQNILAPKIDYVNIPSTNTIEIVFNQKMDKNSLKNVEKYLITEFNKHPISTELAENQSNSVVLTFDEDFTFHDYYEIKVNDVQNCSGIPIDDGASFLFGLPDEPEFGDVVINEILFDPITPAGDYVELFNKSNKVLNINDLKIGVVKESFPNPPDTTIKDICSENRQIIPGHYVLLTTTPTEIGAQYECPTDNYITMSALPSYPNSGAAAVLFYGTAIIDFMSYSDDSHYPLLAVTKGVALERVSPDIASDDTENWHSAAAPLYGTPGYQNSVFIENKDVVENIDIVPSVFSPDGDGFDDVTTINLKDVENDYTARITIFDSQGKFVKTLINNKNIANQNHFVWNGVDENGVIVPVGIYVFFVEIFDIQGDIKRYKKAVVVASK